MDTLIVQCCLPSELSIILIFLTYFITCFKQAISYIPAATEICNLTIRHIFTHNNNWACYKKLKKNIRDIELKEVEKMLNCCNPSKGYMTYQCDDCGDIEHIPFTCKSRICTHCGKKFADKWSEKIANEMFDVPHRHMIFTVPDALWQYIEQDRKLLNVLVNSVNRSLTRLVNQKSSNKNVKLGLICVIHQQGKDLKFNPHIHVIVTEGGLDENNKWVKYNYFHYDTLRLIWKDEVLKGLKKEMKGTDEIKELLWRVDVEYSHGFVLNGKRKIEPNDKKDVARYIARYVRHPAVGERRIINYDGKTVSFYYVNENENKIKSEGKIVKVTMPVFDFIEGILRQIPDPQFKMIRYYGIYAQSKKKQMQTVMKTLSKFRETKKKEKEKLTCKKCGGNMSFIGITYPDNELTDSHDAPPNIEIWIPPDYTLTEKHDGNYITPNINTTKPNTTKPPIHQWDKIRIVKDIIRDLEWKSKDKLAHIDDIKRTAKELNIDGETLTLIMTDLNNKGIIYEPRYERYKLFQTSAFDDNS